MKKIVLASLALLTSAIAWGQSCANYYYMTNNAVITMSTFDAKGNLSGKMVYTVSNVSNSGGTVSSTINSEFFSKMGKSFFKSTGNYKCKGGQLMVDMHMGAPGGGGSPYMKNMQVHIDQSYLFYPTSFHVGDNLQDGHFHMTMTNNGHPFSTMDMSTVNRKVVGKESVTTPAGTWTCYKITFTAQIDNKMMGMGKAFVTSGAEWFAPGFGLIKSESFDQKGQLQGSTELSSYKP
ncbi:MAG TPA: hypothetical protein VNE41_10095 [Chitinophagaceae bacterium]|nr:hypothetical protein [Chitinophagaceae bacterium]